MKDSPAFDRRHQHTEKRQAIIHEAAKAFNECGFEGTSLDTIAKRLGVTKKALYYYIKNKNEILFEIFRQWADVQRSSIHYAANNGKDGIEKLELYAKNYVSTVLNELTPMDRITGEISSLDEESINEIHQRRRDNDQAILQFVEEAATEGHAQGLDPHIVVHTINGSLDWIFKWYRPDGSSSVEEAVNSVLNVILTGLRKR